MAVLREPTREEMRAWQGWLRSRPPVIRAMVRRHHLRPWLLYRQKSTGLRCTLYSVSEDGTVKIEVTGQFNRVMIDRYVFGVDPGDLEECDLPAPDEDLGTICDTPELELEYINQRRAEFGKPPLTLAQLEGDDEPPPRPA